jgi:hypothetical protein
MIYPRDILVVELVKISIIVVVSSNLVFPLFPLVRSAVISPTGVASFPLGDSGFVIERGSQRPTLFPVSSSKAIDVEISTQAHDPSARIYQTFRL